MGVVFRQLFDADTSTYTYLLGDDLTRQAVLIDPVQGQVGRDLALLEQLGLTLVAIVETHVHADHVTGAGWLRDRTGAQTIVSARAGDNVIEAIEHPGYAYCLGVQWHPEWRAGEDPVSRPLFEAFADAARAWVRRDRAPMAAE